MKRVLLLFSALCITHVHAQNSVSINPDQTVSVGGKRLFPISVYIQSDWAGVKKLGVNTASRPFCINLNEFRNAEQAGLYLHYTAGPGCDYENAAAIRTREASGFVKSIGQVKGSNFLFGYGLPDEPVSATGLSPADAQWAYDTIKSNDPTRPVFLTEYARDISAYRDAADIFLNDWYPFGNSSNPLYELKDRVVHMKAQVAPKPVWPIIQTGSQFGMPTNAQIRAATYLSIALGSTGVIFYSYDVVDRGGLHNIKTDGDPAYLAALIGELKNFSPVLLSPTSDALTYNASHIDAILKNDHGKSYLIAVNKSTARQNITFSLRGVANASATVVGQPAAGSARAGQTRPVSASGVLSDTLEGMEAVIYEIGATGGATRGRDR